MWISAREASRIFAVEAGMCRQQSRRVLLAGLAGEPVRVGRVTAYDADRVRDLASRPEVDHRELLRASPAGVFVLRLSCSVRSLPEPWHERAAFLTEQDDVRGLARVQVRARIADAGPLPFVATICGFPVLLAELADLQPSDPGRVHADLTRPSPERRWVHHVTGRRLTTSAGPRWLLLGSQPYLGGTRRARELHARLTRPALNRTQPGPTAQPTAPGARPARRRRRPPADGRGWSRRRR